MLLVVLTVPTTSCAVVIALDAAAWVRPTTFGALTCGRPVETVSAIALPTTTVELGAGDWLTTLPAGTVMLEVVVIVPTVSCASAMAAVASACGRPATSGTVTCGTPAETVSAIGVPLGTSLPALGNCVITEPAGTVRLGALARGETEAT